MSAANPFDYPGRIWHLFRETPRAGSLGAGSISASAGTPASRSVLRLHVKMDGTRITDARFQAYGCPTTIAVGAWLAEQVEGRSPAELAAITAPVIRQALEIPEDRTHCALLGEDVVQSLVKSLSARPASAPEVA